ALDLLVVVDAPVPVRTQRLVRGRGMSASEVARRMGAQARTDELRERADIVVRNDGTLEDLVQEATLLWDELTRKAS
ncbi:MAG: dephospho-CoA kinase, partial [Actinomycetota bacterium]